MALYSPAPPGAATTLMPWMLAAPGAPGNSGKKPGALNGFGLSFSGNSSLCWKAGMSFRPATNVRSTDSSVWPAHSQFM
ncbi:hypothetical protein D3C72_2047130 [compost metagenome]